MGNSKDQVTEIGAVELDEAELDQASAGVADSFSFGVENEMKAGKAAGAALRTEWKVSEMDGKSNG